MRFISRIPPLVLFLSVGAILFVLDALKGESSAAWSEIRVSQARIDSIRSNLEKELGDSVSEELLFAAIDEYIDDEILYREAVALRLHMIDEVVRRRLAQTMAFVVEGRADLDQPGEEQLRDLYRELNEPGNRQMRYSFRHLFFSSDRRGNSAQKDSAEALQAIEQGADPEVYGDPFLSGSTFSSRTLQQIEEEFGTEVMKLVSESDSARWAGPVASPYGTHLLYVNRADLSPLPSYEQMHDKLVLEWRAKRRKALREEALAEWRTKYKVKLPATRQQGEL